MEEQQSLDRATRLVEEKNAADIQKRNEAAEKLKAELGKLFREREEVRQWPMTIRETLQVAKASLAEARQKIFIKEFLSNHLEGVQKRVSDFLPVAKLRQHFLSDGRLYQWVFGNWITERDIEEAAKSLPEGGIGQVEREKKLAQIDKAILALEKRIEEL